MNSKILHAALYCLAPELSWGLPILLWGAPGSGKTSFLGAAARRTNLAYKRISPAEQGEGGFGVVPVPMSDGGYLAFPPPAWSKPFTANGGGLIFVDEISTAPPALQAPLLGLVQLRTLGDFQFPSRTRIVGAANEAIEAVGGWDLASPLANRFGHFEFQGLDADEWSTALMSGFANTGDDLQSVNAEIEERRVMEAWPQAIAVANAVISGFIKRNPGKLHMQPKAHDAKASKAWPSRRTWQYAAHALASAQIHWLSEIDTDTFLSGFVGIGCVSELRTWQTQLDLPNPADVLDGTVKWQHDKRRLDRTLVVLGACAGLAAGDKDAKRRIVRGNRCWDLIGSVLEDAADCAIPAARLLKESKMTTPSEYPSFAKNVKVGARIYELFVASGMVK